MITSAAAKSLDKEVGDMLLVNAGGRTAEYELLGVVSYPAAFAVMRWQDLASWPDSSPRKVNPCP